jgi:tripartite ATP-independent transporter DctP family solute receptor
MKRNGNLCGFIICAAILFVLIIGCGGSGNAPAASGGAEKKTYTMKLSHPRSTDHPYHLGSEMLVSEINKRLGNRFNITIYPNGQLGNNSEVLEATMLGSLDILLTDDGLLSGVVKDFSVLGLPFLFRDTDHVFRVVNSEIGDYFSSLLEPKGMVIICWLENGFRQITNRRGPIRTPADLAGLKIRTPTTKMTVDTFNILGAQASPISANELYSALQLGTVDAQENPTTNILYMTLYEVQKYLSLSAHLHTTEPVVMSLETWKKLTPDEQKAIIDAGRVTSKWSFDNNKTEFATELSKLKELGMQVNDDVVKEEFRAKLKPIYDESTKLYGELIARIQKG